MEHQACCEQSGTERNTGIDGRGQDPAARRRSLRHNHRSGALTRYRHNLVGRTWLRRSCWNATLDRRRRNCPAVVRRWNIAFLLDPVNANAHQETISMDSTVSAAWVG